MRSKRTCAFVVFLPFFFLACEEQAALEAEGSSGPDETAIRHSLLVVERSASVPHVAPLDETSQQKSPRAFDSFPQVVNPRTVAAEVALGRVQREIDLMAPEWEARSLGPGERQELMAGIKRRLILLDEEAQP